jgi:hypothetical protein
MKDIAPYRFFGKFMRKSREFTHQKSMSNSQTKHYCSDEFHDSKLHGLSLFENIPTNK